VPNSRLVFRHRTLQVGKPTPPVRFLVCEVVSILQYMVGYIVNFFECFGCVNELQMEGPGSSAVCHAGVPSPNAIKR